MLNDPNIESPANLDASIMFRDKPLEYKRKVQQMTIDSLD